MLTVMREMAACAATELPDMPNSRLGARRPPELQNEVIAEILERAIAAGEVSVKRGPDLLPVLREAGVVDAGGYGVTILFAGVVAALRGTEPPELEHHAPPARVTHPEHASIDLTATAPTSPSRGTTWTRTRSSGRSSRSATA